MSDENQSKVEVEKTVNDILSSGESDAKKKIKLETLRIYIEFKKNDNVWSKLGISVPWFITIASLVFTSVLQFTLAKNQADIQSRLQEEQGSIQSRLQKEQAEFQVELQKDLEEFQFNLQEQQARTQFQLQAAEMVANSSTPLEAQNKAHALAVLFPDSLSDGFASASFDAENFSVDNIAAKRELINLIVEHPGQEEHIRSLWTEFIGVDITDVGDPSNAANIGVVGWGELAIKLEQDQAYFLELFKKPEFQKFIEVLIGNGDFQQTLAISILCKKQGQNQLTSEDVVLFVNLFGIPDSFNCP